MTNFQINIEKFTRKLDSYFSDFQYQKSKEPKSLLRFKFINFTEFKYIYNKSHNSNDDVTIFTIKNIRLNNFTFGLEFEKLNLDYFVNKDFEFQLDLLKLFSFLTESLIEKNDFFNFFKELYITLCKEQYLLIIQTLPVRKQSLLYYLKQRPDLERRCEYEMYDSDKRFFMNPEFVVEKYTHSITTYQSRPGKDNYEFHKNIIEYKLNHFENSIDKEKLSLFTKYLASMKLENDRSSSYWGPVEEDTHNILKEVDVALTSTLIHLDVKNIFNFKISPPSIYPIIVECLVYFLFLDIEPLLNFIKSQENELSSNFLNEILFLELITMHFENLYEETIFSGSYKNNQLIFIGKFIKENVRESINTNEYDNMVFNFAINYNIKKNRRKDISISSILFNHLKILFDKS